VRRALDGEVRAKTGQGLVGWAGHRDHRTSAHGPRKRDPGLVGHVGGEGVYVANVGIRLCGMGLNAGPIDVAASAGVDVVLT